MRNLNSQLRTKIVATLGPASSSPSVMRELIESGVNVARLNMAHGSHDEHAKRINLFRSVADETDDAAGILMDLPGPKLRVTKLPRTSLEIKRNDEVFLTPRTDVAGKNLISISHKNLLDDIRKNEAVYICDGLIRLRVEQVKGDKIRCVCTHGGTVHVGNGVNMPHSSLSMRAFTPVDQRHLHFGLLKNIDFVGLSFVGDADDVQRVRAFCKARRRSPYLIAKIERHQALVNLDRIIEAADGVMVARGDLGIEEPFYKVPAIQSQIVAAARRAGKPVIVATQVLESMTQNPRPTRAEATDVANAISQGADAIMLSGESAVGKYPVESVRALAEIIRETERTTELRHEWEPTDGWGPKEVMAHEACRIAERVEAKVILVQSQTGRSARRISRFRPRVPVLAFVNDETVRRKVSLLWGVEAIMKSIRTSMYRNTSLFSWLNRRYAVGKTGRAVFIDTPVESGKIVLTVIERR